MSKPEQYVSLVVGPNCESESFAIRSTLEHFGARVTLHLIGRPNDLVDVLSSEDLNEKTDYLILNFHGDEGRFCIPELGEDVYEEDEPRGEFFTIEDVKRCAKLQDTHIIASGCTLGIEELANVFLACGCQSYIAPDDYIDGNANLMFVIRFMYEIIQNKRSQQEAFTIAKSIDEETSMYKRYSR
uniref:delta-aminolevulinic acid dehydratase n=1 Tax=Bacillus sp. DX2.2 TaxID=3073452 RepID=UPI00402ACA6C